MGKNNFEEILISLNKADMISFINNNPECFEKAVKLSFVDKQPCSWRAAWLLWSCMEENDKRVRKYLKEIINALPLVKDNQFRELLIVLRKMEIDDKYEGKLFNICVNAWENIGKQPSVRHNAFRIIVKIIKKYPELINEITFLTEPHYVDCLSAGVKNSVNKMISEIRSK